MDEQPRRTGRPMKLLGETPAFQRYDKIEALVAWKTGAKFRQIQHAKNETLALPIRQFIDRYRRRE